MKYLLTSMVALKYNMNFYKINCLFQAGTPNPTVTMWLKDLKNDNLSNVTLLQKPQALHMER